MRLPILLLAVLLPSASPQTTTPPPAVDVRALGPQIGQRAPDFSLTDQNGAARTLKSLLGPKGAMIVFFRSADW